MNRRALFLLIIVVVTIATFGWIVTHPFVSWDDPDTIVGNLRLRPPSLQNVAWYWTNQAGGLYIPLTYTIWSAIALVAQLSGGAGPPELHPWAFHAASVLLHAAAACVAFDLLRRLIEHAQPVSRPTAARAALVGALLFAVHPLQAETVAWASGMKDLLCGLLSLVAIRYYVLSATAGPSQARRQWTTYALAAMAMLLAMLSKPTAVVTPLIAGAIDLWALGRPPRFVIRSVMPLLALVLPLALLARLTQDAYDATYTPLWTRPLIATDAIAFYLGKLVFPRDLVPIYGRTPPAVVQSGAIFYTWIAPVLIGISLRWLRKRAPVLVAAAAVFIAGLLPVLGFSSFMMQVHSTVADHYMYLPLFGVALAAAWGVSRFPNRAVYLSSAVVLALLAVVSFLQLRYWQNSVTLFAHTVDVVPDSADTRGHLGWALLQAGRLGDAVPHLARSVELSPNSRLGRASLAQALIFTGRYEQGLPHAAEALRLAVLEGSHETAMEHFLLARALSKLGHLEPAERHFVEALRQRPDDANLAEELESVRRRIRDAAGSAQRLDSPTTRQ